MMKMGMAFQTILTMTMMVMEFLIILTTMMTATVFLTTKKVLHALKPRKQCDLLKKGMTMNQN